MLPSTNSDFQAVDEDEFTAEELSAVNAIIQNNRSKPESLIPVLENVLEALGYLPKSTQRKITLGLGGSLIMMSAIITDQ